MRRDQVYAHDERIFDAMGTTAHVIVIGHVTSHLGDLSLALDTAADMIEEAEARWSRFRPSSELSQINIAAGRPIRVSDATFNLLATAMLARSTTEGAFDPTVGAALIEAGYHRSLDELDAHPVSTMSRGPHGVDAPRQPTLEPITQTITVPVGTQLDLGGIAKGATADAVAEYLIRTGVAGCCVSIGGDMRVTGVGPADGAWQVDLDCPGSLETRSIRLSDGGVATSSITKRSWTRNDSGQSAHHLIDPSTLTPRQEGPAAATVIAKTATSAEVLTKWVMAGGDPGDFDATGLVVNRDGAVHTFAGIDQYFADGRAA